MIRQFKAEDFDKIEKNEFFETSLSKDQYLQFISQDHIHTYTQYDNEGIKAIIIFFNIGQDIYNSGLVFSNMYNMSNIKEFKLFMKDAIDAYKIRRLETESIDSPVLNRWHEFLGFTLEGTKREYINKRNYNIWGMV